MCNHRLAAWSIALACLSAPSIVHADPRVVERHPQRFSPIAKPPAVPSNYILTRNGFLHPSCVITVGEDEAVGADLVIRGVDGNEHARITPCAYPRFSATGRTMARATPGSMARPAPVGDTLLAAPSDPPPPQAVGAYDGYILLYAYSGRIAAGSTLTTDWTVPPRPTNVANQDIAFFNGIQTSSGGGDILQPVLEFNSDVGHWIVESEHCCISGNDMQTTGVTVNSGDLIRGTVAGTNCDSTGVCPNWAVTTADLTTGKSTTLNLTALNGAPNLVTPASLETYGVTSCDMFPAGGEDIFFNNQVADQNGVAQNLTYRLSVMQGVDAEVPRNCGQAGMSSGDTFTLIYGTNPMPPDGGAGARDAAADGAGRDAASRDAATRDATSVDAGSDAAARADAGGRGPDAANDARGGTGATDGGASGTATSGGTGTSGAATATGGNTASTATGGATGTSGANSAGASGSSTGTAGTNTGAGSGSSGATVTAGSTSGATTTGASTAGATTAGNVGTGTGTVTGGGSSASGGADLDTSESAGCACRTASSRRTPAPSSFTLAVAVVVAVSARRRAPLRTRSSS